MGALQPWHSVPIFPGRDLANDELWLLSAKLAASRRELARRPMRLPRARRTSVSLLAAAITAATPAISLAHPGSQKTPRPGSGVATAKTLTVGSRGPAVVQLQRALGITADGIFGPVTLRAVRSFQRRAGLAVDGIVGPLTLAALRTSRRAGTSGILELGSRGPAVAELQRALGIPDDGIFGKQTRRAVREFQRHQGLLVDGQVGPQTRAALSARNLAGSSSASVIKLGDQGPAVAELQRALGIPADGIFGTQTLDAVRDFQQAAGISVDGLVGHETRAALDSSGADAAGAASGDQGHAPSESDQQATESTSDQQAIASTNGEQAAQLAASENVDARLGPALALAKQMGLTLISGYRPGATIAASGGVSDHSYSPSRAIDIHGSQAQMRAYARQVAGMANVETVIFSPVGIWLAGQGWGEIRTSVTYQEHLDHVHVDTF